MKDPVLIYSSCNLCASRINLLHWCCTFGIFEY